MPWQWVGVEDDDGNRLDVTPEGKLTISGDVTVTGPVAIVEPVTVEGTVSVNEPVTVDGTIDANGLPKANSAFAAGTVLAPTAGQQILISLPSGSGLFHIQVTAWYSSGSPLAADNRNMEFRFGASPLASLAVVPALNIPVTNTLYFTGDGSTPMSVNATGAGTAGVTYNATLVATRIS